MALQKNPDDGGHLPLLQQLFYQVLSLLIVCARFLSINMKIIDCRKQTIDVASPGNRDGWRQIFTRSILKFDKCAGERMENWTRAAWRYCANGNHRPVLYLQESRKQQEQAKLFIAPLKRFSWQKSNQRQSHLQRGCKEFLY